MKNKITKLNIFDFDGTLIYFDIFINKYKYGKNKMFYIQNNFT